MSETLKTIFERFSCRDFKDTPLSDEQIKTLAEAALASPSAVNLQPWRIIMITDKKLIEDMDSDAMETLKNAEDKSTYQRFMDRGGKMFYNAPCMVMVASDGSDSAAMDCGILSQNVSLAAHALGLGSVICGMARIPLEGARSEEFLKRMNFPSGWKFGIAVLVGEVKTGKEPHELDMSKVSYVK